MDSLALQAVFAPYVDTPSRHTNGHSTMTTSTGEGSTTMRRRHDGPAVREADREAAEAARRALQMALDRRDNGGSV